MRTCWKRTSRFQAVVAFLGLWVACTLGEAQTISNPSFEANSFANYPGYISGNGNIVGWTASDNTHAGLNPYSGTNNPFADNGTVPDGNNVAFIQFTNSLSTVISNLTVGETYKVNFRVNARTNVGGMPNLNVWIDATNIINSTVTPVAPMGFPNPYKYFAFDFTAAATNHQTMTLSNDASGDQTVLLDNFSIAVRNSGWSYAAWNGDASSGVVATNIYTHAYSFGSGSNATINGVTFTGIPGGNPAVAGSFSTAGLLNVFNNDNNNLTSGGGGSSQLARDFVFGGAVESLTIQGLAIGRSYVATIYSVGFDASGTRAATFSAGNDRLTVNQDQFGDHNGIRLSCHFTANATSDTLTYVPLKLGTTFHTYGFSVYQLPELIVTNAADSGPGSLRTVAEFATNGATITFTNTLSGQTILLTNGQITISSNVTIEASSLPAGITLSGNNSNRIFEVSPGAALNLYTLTLINGNAGASSGGAIYVDAGGTLTLNNSTLSSNSASVGGCIRNDGTLEVNNSTLSGNSSGNYCGGIENTGALTVNNSTLSSNSTTGGGGGIECEPSSTLTLNNSTLSGNSASVGGGINDYGGSNTLNNSTLSGNTAGDGGGISVYNGGQVWLTNTIVAGNSTGSADTNIYINSGGLTGVNNLTNGNPQLAPLGNYGGPTRTMPPLTGSPALDAGTDSVTNFLATDQRGFPRKAGAHVDIGAVEYMGSPLVTTTADTGGSGSLRNAAVYATNGATITFANTLSGQVIVLTNGQITLYDNITIDASSLPAGVTVSGNHSNRIFEVSMGTTVELNALTLTYGSFFTGGAIYVDAGGTLTLNNSTLSSNSATTGAGIYNNGTLALDNSTLSSNSATSGGGGIFNPGTLALINSTLSGNSAGAGAGIYNNGTLALNNSTLSSNSATSGGGIYNFGTLALINSTLSGNSAGGGVDSSGTLTLTNTIVAGNSPYNISGSFTGSSNLIDVNPQLTPLGNYGGLTQTMPPLPGSPAIDAGDDSVTSFLATDQRGFPRMIGFHVDIGAAEYFSRPFVTTTADAGGGSLRDAAVYATNGATVTFTNTLSGQTIVLINGQLALNQNVTIDASSLPAGVIVSGNQTDRLFEVVGTTVTMGSLTLTNGYADSNSLGGGAILVDYPGTLTLNNSTLAGNSSFYYGGGIENDSTLTLNNSTLSGNSASVGGGIDDDYTSSNTINNSTLSGNTAGDGAGIECELSSTLTLNNSTLVGNSAGAGGGIECDSSSTLTLNNSTLSGNSASNYGAGISIISGGGLTLTNTIVAGNSPDNISGGGAVSGVNNLTNGNPLLAPLGNSGGPTQTMPPLSGSPAIDAGTDSVTNFLATDQRGFPRLSGAHVDIGAAEVQFVAVPANNRPALKNVLRTSAGGTNTFQFSFTNVPSADFTALASTNVSMPLSNWTVLGNVQEISPGQYQFTDSGTNNFPKRFYLVVSP